MGWGSAKQRCPQPKSKQPAGKLQGWLVVVVLLVACSLLYFTGGHNGQLFVLSSPKRWDELPTDRPARFFLLGVSILAGPVRDRDQEQEGFT